MNPHTHMLMDKALNAPNPSCYNVESCRNICSEYAVLDMQRELECSVLQDMKPSSDDRAETRCIKNFIMSTVRFPNKLTVGSDAQGETLCYLQYMGIISVHDLHCFFAVCSLIWQQQCQTCTAQHHACMLACGLKFQFEVCMVQGPNGVSDQFYMTGFHPKAFFKALWKKMQLA